MLFVQKSITYLSYFSACPLPNCRMPTSENEQVHGASTEAVNLLKRNSDDVGWEYGVLVDANNKDKVRCNLCNKEMRGGIYRLKQHLAHEGKNVTKCPARTQQASEAKAKCKKALEDAKRKTSSKCVKQLDSLDLDFSLQVMIYCERNC